MNYLCDKIDSVTFMQVLILFIAIVAAFYSMYVFLYIFIIRNSNGEEEPSELHSHVRYEQTAKLMEELKREN